MNNQTEVSIKFRNYVEGQGKLDKYAKKLANVKALLSGLDRDVMLQIEKSANNIKEIKENTKNTSETVKKAFNYSQIREFSRALERTFKVMSSLATKSSAYLENVNLFQVAFDGSYESAEKFVNKLSDMYGLDESWLVRTTGIFKQLSNAMNLSVEQGTKLSTLLTQMSVDISSLYNVDIERASSTLQSALAGQTKPIRATTGADITQNTLQQTLSSLGINKYVGDLSYAEKRLVIIISLTRQLSQATNDFGRTIESPANQMRILSEQWERLSRAVGNLFMPILAEVLPYLNAILMVMTEIVNLVASLFGFDESDYDYFGGVADSVVDLEEELDGANEGVKKLKQGLRGFDKLNVINTPTANSGAGTNIDPDIMDAFNNAFDEYNSKLQDVQMKATKIRDSIMEWLGFTKQIDSETGKVKFQFEKITGGTIIGALAVGGVIFSGLSAIVKLVSNVNKLLGTSGTFSILKKLIEPIKVLGAKDGLHYIFLESTRILKKFLPIITKVAVVLGSIAGIYSGTKGIYNVMKKTNKETKAGGKDWDDYWKGVQTTTVSATALGLALGGPVGGAIGAVTGLILSGITAYEGYQARLDALARSNLFGELNISLEEWNEILNENGVQVENYSSKLDTLKESLAGLNESFVSSSEQLDLYGYKFGVIGQKISEEDSVKIVDAINNMATQSKSIIEENTNFSLQLWGDSFAKMSVLTEEEEKNILTSIYNYGQQQKDTVAEIQKNITETFTHGMNERGYLTTEEYKFIQEQLEKLRQLTQIEMTKNQSEIEFLKLQFADTNLKLDEESYKNFQKALEDYQKEELEKYKENYRIKLEQAEFYKQQAGFKEEEYQDMLKNAYAERIQNEENLKKSVLEIQEDVYKALDERYSELLNNTSEVARKEKNIIENIFSNLNLNDKELQSKFKNAGTIARKNFEKGLGKSDVQVHGNIILGFSTQSAYADGGLPPVGQVFVANEQGPELIGQIGGQSFVANQNQVVDLLDRKLANAGGGLQSATFIIQVGDEEVANVMVDKFEDIAKTNGKPIMIGG